MNRILEDLLLVNFVQRMKLLQTAQFSVTPGSLNKFKVLIVGGGAGGITVANRINGSLEKGQLGIIEPNPNHFYQPLWTLVGAGIYGIEASSKPTQDYVPYGATWIQSQVKSFEPGQNELILENGQKVSYEWLVIAMGMRLRYDQIKGADEALAKDPRVCSNYRYDYCQKTYEAFKAFPQGGTAVFSHPNSPIKCGGAPQKILYLFDDYLCKNKKRDGSKMEFVTSLPGMFPVPKYSDSLIRIADSRGITRHHKSHIIEIQHDKSLVTVENIDNKTTKQLKYDLLHLVPPMCSPEPIASNKELTTPDSNGYASVDKGTMRSTQFPNIFAIGDCSSLPTSKTAAAVASQSALVAENLMTAIHGGSDFHNYDGYTSCPLITGYNRGIIAEFGYDNKIMETLPFDQSKEHLFMAWIKKSILPNLYWNGMLPGLWPGPKYLRKLFHWNQK